MQQLSRTRIPMDTCAVSDTEPTASGLNVNFNIDISPYIAKKVAEQFELVAGQLEQRIQTRGEVTGTDAVALMRYYATELLKANTGQSTENDE